MPRFVVLEHDHPVLHWDLMLEADGTLRTWRLGTVPAASVTTPCEQLADHRHAYLEYEGPVSGGRGCVKRVMAGDYDILETTSDVLRFRLVTRDSVLEGELSPPAGAGQATFR
ncbi:MAG TPA: DNA polymerase ligase N-terminal domain-containing protein [Caulifigura sp.]|nr:DNA polymerase ligase N-terminal domain-containing protein [Caulifigura sp.]